jgi:hypothetical protein
MIHPKTGLMVSSQAMLRRAYLICIIAGFFSVAGVAEDVWAESGGVFVVISPTATVFQNPLESSKTGKQLMRGRRIEAAGDEENGFIPVKTRMGSRVWLRSSDLKSEASRDTSAELEPSEPRSESRPQTTKPSIFGLQRLTFDLGASGGAVGEISYTEAQLGLNAYFYEWLAWRNAVFGRFPSKGTSIYGLDSSARGILDLSVASTGLTIFAGPGVRFPNAGAVTPFGELGALLKFIGIAVGGGAKIVLNSWVHSGAANDTQYFIILAGGGDL